MKKFLSIILSVTIMALFFGCTSNSTENEGNPPKTEEQTSEAPTQTETPPTEEAITYTITYDLGIEKNNPKVKIQSATQTVEYNQNYVLYIPTEDVNEFAGWKIKDTETMFTDGIYTFTEDIVLVAQWIEYSITV